EVLQFRQTLIRLTSLMHGSALDEISGNREDSYETIDVMGLDMATLRFLRDCKLRFDWNKVCALQHMIQVLITHNLRIGVLDIPPPILSRVYQTLSRGFVNLLNAVKIKDTNFPFPWAQIIMLLLVVHSIFTPLIVTSMMTSYQWAIPVTFLPVFGMFALNQVAAQLEMPFGQDDNDLPLGHFQREMNQSLLQLMHEMADHLPSTKASATTNLDELRAFVGGSSNGQAMIKSDSKAFETMALEEVEPVESKLELELETEMPKLEEKAAEKPGKLPTEEEAPASPLMSPVPAPEAYAVAARHVAEIARSAEGLLLLSQSFPAALKQHCEAMSRFTESVPQLLQQMKPGVRAVRSARSVRDSLDVGEELAQRFDRRRVWSLCNLSTDGRTGALQCKTRGPLLVGGDDTILTRGHESKPLAFREIGEETSSDEGVISIYAENGGESIAVVFDPWRDELFSAVGGQGAELNGRRLQANSDALSDVLVGTDSPPDSRCFVPQLRGLYYLAPPRARGVRVLASSALGQAWVACGRLGAFFTFQASRAGKLLVREAGGVAKRGTSAQNVALYQQLQEVLQQANAVRPLD
ncbi:unnamed protein product, partial [Effrenium voratum]